VPQQTDGRRDLPGEENLFRLLIQAVTDFAIFLIDPKGYVLNWNDGAERIKGYTAAEVIGKHFSVFYTEDDRKAGAPAQLIETAISEGRAETEGWRVRKDGSLFWANVIMEPVRDLTGRLIGVANITRDISERHKLELDKDELLREKDLLLAEMNHRVNNSLQIVASILMMKARTVESPETRRHLREAHDRVMAVATIQQQLHPAPLGARINISTYLTKLCESLAASMILDGQPISISVEASEGTATSAQVISMGLITTELVINSLKHAFPDGAKGKIVVRFESLPNAWRLSVSDDGVGITRPLTEAPAGIGLGTSIVEALARQLGARVMTSAGSPGTTISVTAPRTA